jgi:hypothetical protein
VPSVLDPFEHAARANAATASVAERRRYFMVRRSVAVDASHRSDARSPNAHGAYRRGPMANP